MIRFQNNRSSRIRTRPFPIRRGAAAATGAAVNIDNKRRALGFPSTANKTVRFGGAQAPVGFPMESNHNNSASSQKPEEEDSLNALPDDILLSVLGRVDVSTAARTSVLSTRWRLLPWLLPELNIDVKNFLTVPIGANDMDEAMASLTKATRSFLAKPRTISRLRLKLYLINNYSCDIGPLVGHMIDTGLLKDLDLAILDEKDPLDCSDEDMIQLAQDIHGLFTAYPSVLNCLTRLSLYNVRFGKLDMHHLLFDCCKQLKHLTLSHCDASCRSLYKIDAPNSKLSVLELQMCEFERLELVFLPKLQMLKWGTWVSRHAPLSFGFVPSLGELELSCGTAVYHRGFKLSELLHGATSIHTLTLDFEGENLWMQPEIKQLHTAFKKLRNLSVRGIYVEFDILWTMAFLEVAPSVRILQIEVWEHPCDMDIRRQETFPERMNPQWAMDFRSSKNWLLEELQFVGFRSLEQQFTFIRAILERAPNLQTIALKGDEQCDDCDALGAPPCSKFPKKNEEKEMVVRRIRDGIFSPKIIFDE